MSNIPNSAMPHAWAQDDGQQLHDANADATAPSLRKIAVMGGIGALLPYFVLRK